VIPRARSLAAAAASGLAAAAAGCGLGSGPGSPGTATLVVTRDYGAERLVSAREQDPPAAETVLRFLDRAARITTRYGGGFVQSINGLAGGERGGRRFDWFFYVNGVESPTGAAEVTVHGGDAVWWDYRDWTAAMRVPAVIGQWPQPFAGASGPVPVLCATRRALCARVARSIASAGAAPRPMAFAPGARAGSLRVIVGAWPRIRRDPAAGLLAGPPSGSGVFARFSPGGALSALDAGGGSAATFRSRAGLLAAVRDGERPPTWLVSGTDAAGVGRAAAALAPAGLRDRYALAISPAGRMLALPVAEAGR